MLSEENIIKLLSEKDILVVDEGNKLYIDNRKDDSIPIENHYGISLEQGKWSYCLYKAERRNFVETEVLKQFNDKEHAENYLFFKALKHYFLFGFVIPRRDYNVSKWNIEALKKDMNRLGIPQNYLSYSNNMQINSIYFFEENKFWYHGYINNETKLIYQTKKGIEDSEWLFSLYANKVYVLYLFDLYTKKLLERKLIDRPFNDLEKLIVLGYQ